VKVPEAPWRAAARRRLGSTPTTNSKGPSALAELGFPDWELPAQIQVQEKDVYARFTQKAQIRHFGVGGDELTYLL